MPARNTELRQARAQAVSFRRWLTRKESALYLGMDPLSFDQNVRPFIPESHGSSRPLFDKNDIDKLIEGRKRRPARTA